MDRSELVRHIGLNRNDFCLKVWAAAQQLRGHMNLTKEDVPNFEIMQRHHLEEARTIITEMLEDG